VGDVNASHVDRRRRGGRRVAVHVPLSSTPGPRRLVSVRVRDGTRRCPTASNGVSVVAVDESTRRNGASPDVVLVALPFGSAREAGPTGRSCRDSGAAYFLVQLRDAGVVDGVYEARSTASTTPP
jgi:hypothetical protein